MSSIIRRAGGALLRLITRSADPTAEANRLLTFSKNVAGREFLSTIGPNGDLILMQPLLAFNKVGLWLPPGAATAPGAFGMTAPTTTGTATARTPASTNLVTSTRRLGYVSLALANSVAGARGQVRQFWRGNAAGLGGFFATFRFNISDAVLVATANMFVGFEDSVAAPTDVAPSTLINMIGVGCDNGDTTLQLYASGAAAQARINLGANFPVNTTDVDLYELVLYCSPNAANIQYLVTRLNTGHTASGTISAAASLPASTLFWAPRMWRANGGTAAAVGIDLVNTYIGTLV